MTLLTTSGDIHAATMATSHFLREKRKVKSDGSEERRVKSEESACGDSICSCSPLILTVAARSAI